VKIESVGKIWDFPNQEVFFEKARGSVSKNNPDHSFTSAYPKQYPKMRLNLPTMTKFYIIFSFYPSSDFSISSNLSE